MKRAQLAIVGFGALGRACALGLLEAADFELAGVIRRSGGALPAPLHRVAVAAHLRDLKPVDAALLCVPPDAAGSGIVLERRATATAGRHESLLLEARFDAPAFAARVMLDAARGLAALAPGAHRHALR